MQANPRRRERTVILLILLLAATLRLWGLGGKSLWFDEIMTADKASKSFGAMIEAIKDHDAHPPFYQTVVWLWMRCGRPWLLFGGRDGFVRFPSAVAGVVGVWLACLIARRLFGRNAAVAAALLMAVSYFHIYYSQEARLHALVTTLFLAQTYLLLRIIHQRGRAAWGWWAAYGFLGLLSLYTYALSILTIGALAVLYLWLTRRRRRQLAEWVAVHVVIGLLFLPWVPVLRQTAARVAESVEIRADAAGSPGPIEIASGFASWGVGPFQWVGRERAGAVVGLALVLVAGAGVVMRKTSRPAKILGTLFLLPLAGYLLMPMPRVQAYDPKHLAFLQPLLMIALAGVRFPALCCRRSRTSAPMVPLIIAAAALNVFALGSYYDPDFEKENWRALFEEVGAKLALRDAIIFNPNRLGFAVEYYAEAPAAMAGVKLLAERGAPLALEGKQLPPTVERIWLIECRNPVSMPSEHIRENLSRHHWSLVERARYLGALGYVQWTLLEREAPSGETVP